GNVIMLTADAFGVLPPVSRLSPEQALYYFLSGYTSKLAGTELGVTEPEATFSACFGAPFLTRHPVEYARLLGDRIRRHDPPVWLVNTGWTGGPYGIGERMSIAHTRSIIQEIVTESLRDMPVSTEPIFGLAIPDRCGEVPADVLHPERGWRDRGEYIQQARALATLFDANFREFADEVEPDVAVAGPRPI
nr:phosphoenolpyruvate carboxykinase (ATP) [Chloroflexota bacterium]